VTGVPIPQRNSFDIQSAPHHGKILANPLDLVKTSFHLWVAPSLFRSSVSFSKKIFFVGKLKQLQFSACNLEAKRFGVVDITTTTLFCG